MGSPRNIGHLLPTTLKEFGLDQKAERYSVLDEWPTLVGKKVAEVTTPLKVERGVLVVQVANSVWNYELTMRKAEILRKVQARFGPHVVSDIRWK